MCTGSGRVCGEVMESRGSKIYLVSISKGLRNTSYHLESRRYKSNDAFGNSRNARSRGSLNGRTRCTPLGRSNRPLHRRELRECAWSPIHALARMATRCQVRSRELSARRLCEICVRGIRALAAIDPVAIALVVLTRALLNLRWVFTRSLDLQKTRQTFQEGQCGGAYSLLT